MCERIEAAPDLPIGAVYTPSLGTVGVAMYTYTADQMREYGEACRMAERDVWRPDAERYRGLSAPDTEDDYAYDIDEVDLMWEAAR